MKSKIILILLVISSLIIGCVDAPKSISSNIEISETLSEIADKVMGDCVSGIGGTLTTEQCDYWVENNINNKYVNWSGTVSDVRDNIVFVFVDYKNPSGIVGTRTYSDISATVELHDIKKDELININKNNKIQFVGKINIKRFENMFGTGMYSLSYIKLYDVKIIKPDNTESSIKSIRSGISSVTPTVIPIIPPQIGIAYHIDTLPPGKGVVYINNKISPTTGTLPPGSYNIKLVVGSKTYESTMYAAEGGSIELIQPVEW